MSRGQLPDLLEMAAKIAETRLQTLVQALDDMAEVNHQAPFGGRPISRATHLRLLAENEGYQEGTLAALPFASEKEREQLKRDLDRVRQLYPEVLPPDVANVPPQPWEPGGNV